MEKSQFSYGLNLAKKPGVPKPSTGKRKPIFGEDNASDDDAPAQGSGAVNVESISELDDFAAPSRTGQGNGNGTESRSRRTDRPAHSTGKVKKPPPLEQQFGDLSSALSSRKHAAAAEELDPSIYDYDAVYDSFRPDKSRGAAATKEDVERRPKYLSGLRAAAAVRQRDALIAEEKKIARERAAEGDEFAGTDKFVTEAYRRQQEENRLLQEEEARREEAEEKKRREGGGGMTGFYKDLLEQGDQRHAEMVRAAEERKKQTGSAGDGGGRGPTESEEQEEKTEADIAREINDKGGSVALNVDGQVVDKRQLLRGGLNVGAKKKAEADQDRHRQHDSHGQRGPERGSGFVGAGGKQAMRERQSRMLEEQLEQALKRSRDEEDEERRKVEVAAKSRKTDADVSSAKERYLARKRAAEEEKRNGVAS